MSSPIPDRGLFSEYAVQPPLQPVSSISELDNRHYSRIHKSASVGQLHGTAPPPIYVQPAVEVPPVIAELPAPLPPAPPTSTPAEQLTEDELLAHKLQRLEVAQARASSVSNVTVHPPQFPWNGGVAPTPQYLIDGPYDSSRRLRPHSYSLSSPYEHQQYAQASQLQLSPNATPADLAPEVLLPRPISTHPPVSRPHQSARLPPAPTDPHLLSLYLEQYRQVPYPPQWILPPVVDTLYASIQHAPKSDWLDTLESQLWHRVRPTKITKQPPPPAFQFSLKVKGGNFRNPQFSWSMTPAGFAPNRRNTWRYNLKLDPRTSKRLEESLTTPEGKFVLCTYIHAKNYDSLRFIGLDGRTYKWVSSGVVSSLNGSRYDTIRHALFVSAYTNQDPLYGQIVADHTYIDGFVDHEEVHEGINCQSCNTGPLVGKRWKCRNCPDHNICDSCRTLHVATTPGCDFTLVSLPNEAVYVRSPKVDVGMIVATLQIMKDWEKIILREERKKKPGDFAVNVEAARQDDIGRMSYWKSSDFEGSGVDEVYGTLVAAREHSRRSSVAKQSLGGDRK